MNPLLLIQILTAVAPLANDAIAFWTTAKTVASQSTEWTPELEAAFDTEIAKIGDQPYEKEQPL